MNRKIIATFTLFVILASISTMTSLIVPIFANNESIPVSNEESSTIIHEAVTQNIVDETSENDNQITSEISAEHTNQTTETTCEPTLVDVAIAVNSDGDYAGLFDTLIAAVLAADPAVVETLTSCDQYTVFAPTDDAFAAFGLTPETVGNVSQSLLTDILLYHVVSGRLDSGTVISRNSLCTLKGASLRQSGGILTDKFGREASIIVTDVEAANGIIHVIDAVVLPCEAQSLIN